MQTMFHIATCDIFHFLYNFSSILQLFYILHFLLNLLFILLDISFLLLYYPYSFNSYIYNNYIYNKTYITIQKGVLHEYQQ